MSPTGSARGSVACRERGSKSGKTPSDLADAIELRVLVKPCVENEWGCGCGVLNFRPGSRGREVVYVSQDVYKSQMSRVTEDADDDVSTTCKDGIGGELVKVSVASRRIVFSFYSAQRKSTVPRKRPSKIELSYGRNGRRTG